MTKMITTALAAIVVLASVPSAFAATPGETVTFKVSTAGLDLRNSHDARSMLRRIENAASNLCGGTPYIGDLAGTYQWKACVSSNVNHAMTQMGAPMVAEAARQPTAIQTARNGR